MTPTIQRLDDDAFQLTLPTAVLTFDRVRDSTREGVQGSLSVHWTAEPNPRLLVPSTRVSFEKGTWQGGMLRALNDAEDSVDWSQQLTNAFNFIVAQMRTGPQLNGVDRLADPSPKFLIRPILSSSGATVIAAMGGTGKGWYAIAAALTVATGRTAFLGLPPLETLPVIYLDWEDDRDYFAERVHAMCRPHGIKPPGPDQLAHAECRAPLRAMTDGLIRDLRQRGVHRALFVIDSRGAAAGSDVNEAAGTNDLYDHIRRLPGPALVVDHQSWEASRKQRDGAIGSVYGWNRPRMIWNADSATTTEGINLLIRNPKFNRGRKQDPHAWAITLETGEHEELHTATLRPIPPSTVTTIGGTTEAPLADRITAILTGSEVAWTVDEIAAAVDKAAHTVRSILSRHSDRFVNVSDDRKGRWTTIQNDPRQALPDPL